ncbi:Polynucleotide 5'-hydroxyl-kinase grc3, partial [Dipsacomyces acuminosporus]
VDVDSLPQATTWDPDCGVRSIIVGIRDGGDGKDKGSASYEILDEGAAFERRHGSVFELPEGQAVVFQGVVDLCVLSGAVNVYEHTVTAGSGWSRIYSPSSHPLVSITAVRPSTGLDSNATSTGDGVERMRELWGSQAGSNADRAKRNLAVVALRSVVCGFEDIGAVVPPYRNLFAIKDFAERKAATQPSKAAKRRLAQRNASIAAKAMKTAAGSSIKDEAASVEDTEDDKAARDTGGYDSDDSDEEQAVSIDYAQIELGLKRAIGLPNFSPVSHMTPDLQLLQTPQDWRDTLDRVADAGLQLDDSFEPISPVCVIAGGVSQGKSTFTRLLINRLLRRFGRLFYMETDLGQSEFSPPGALTLSM